MAKRFALHIQSAKHRASINEFIKRLDVSGYKGDSTSINGVSFNNYNCLMIEKRNYYYSMRTTYLICSLNVVKYLYDV